MAKITIELDWNDPRDSERVEGAVFGADAIKTCLELQAWLELQLSPQGERHADHRHVLREVLEKMQQIMRSKRPAATVGESPHFSEDD